MESIYELSEKMRRVGRTYVDLGGGTRLSQLCRAISLRQHKDYDVLHLITGGEGVGKSTFGLLTQISVASMNHTPFSFSKNIIFSPDYEKTKRAMVELPKMSGLQVDEAIKILYNRKWSDKPQKSLTEFLALIRQRNLYMTACIPKLNEIDPYVRKGRAHIWTHVIRRGLALVFGQSPNPFSPKDDVFQSELIYKTINDMGNKAYNVAAIVRRLKYVNNFWGYILYKDLPPKYGEAYKKLKEKLALDLPTEKPEVKSDEMLHNAIAAMFKEGKSAKQIAEDLKGHNKEYVITPYKITRIINKMKETPKKEVNDDGNEGTSGNSS